MGKLLVKLSEMGLHFLIPLVSYLYHGTKTGLVLKYDLHLHWDSVISFSICLAVFLSWLLRNQLEGKKSFTIIKYFIDLIFIILIVSEYYTFGQKITLLIGIQIFVSVGAYVSLECIFHHSNKAYLNNKKSLK